MQEKQLNIILITTKRIYDEPGSEDGYRVLVDRIWPRGISKQQAAIDLWLKEISPSTTLRKWFNHDPEKWSMFQQKYIAELESNKNTVRKLINIENDKRTVTLLYAAKDTEHNHALVIQNFLHNHI